jgi:hypothetical protein
VSLRRVLAAPHGDRRRARLPRAGAPDENETTVRAKRGRDKRIGKTCRLVAPGHAWDGLLVRYLGYFNGYPFVRALEPLPADTPSAEGREFVWSVDGDGSGRPWVVWGER